MKVLLLTPRPGILRSVCLKAGDTCVVSTATPDQWPKDIDFVVSYGYRHIIKEPYLSQYKNRMINIHCSILPWNRGSDPNFWSWFDGTPKGISIHIIDGTLDGGPIIMQMDVSKWKQRETLRSSYDFLQECAEKLFGFEWERFRKRAWFYLDSVGVGSYHKSVDKDPWMKMLPLGWDTPVEDVEKLGAKHYEQAQQRLG